MIESGSSIQTFLTCPKLYEFKYVKLLDPKGYGSALGLGTFVHACVEGGVAPDRELERLLAQKDPQYHDQIKLDFSVAARLHNLWLARWRTGLPLSNDAFEWLEHEGEWAFPVGLHTHVGKRDALVKDKKTGAIFLYELKTATDRDRESYVHKLEIDRQVSSNLLALKHAGVDVAGVLYDIIWKPAIRRMTGRKTKPDETASEFADRLVTTVELAPEGFFQREIVYRSDRLLAEHEHDLKLQFEMIDNAASGGYCRNTGSCDNYGQLCAFMAACLEGRSDLEELHAKREKKLPELSIEIQSTQGSQAAIRSSDEGQ